MCMSRVSATWPAVRAKTPGNRRLVVFTPRRAEKRHLPSEGLREVDPHEGFYTFACIGCSSLAFVFLQRGKYHCG